ncbi:MAG: putative lipoprotein YiaD precursor [Bacteroidetes bacterium ADurb.Bin234]|nr:MAG: putative lipoprotein YiaD precursor [Bacteroidetes bacterium ADurb.Bin234]
MKKISLISISICFILTSCVSKLKYTECTDNLQICQDQNKSLESEKLEYQTKMIELEASQKQALQKVAALENDILLLQRSNKELKAGKESLQKNYDDLLTAYKSLSAGNKKEAEIILKNLQELQLALEQKEKQLNELSKSLEQKSADLKEQQKQLTELQAILDKKDQDIQNLKNKIKQALQGFEGSGLSVTEKNGKIYVSMEEQLLFATGSYAIGEHGKEALKKLAAVLETDKTISVMVEGHTDNVKYNPSASSQIKDNWDLSVMRATSVVKTLLAYGNIEPERLIASGRSEYVPLDIADTKEARAKNRRTEIILTPKLDQLFEILE